MLIATFAVPVCFFASLDVVSSSRSRASVSTRRAWLSVVVRREDAIDSALGGESEEEEVDAVVDAVFEELQIDLFSGMAAAPTAVAAAAAAEPEPEATDADVDDMMARLEALRG